MRARIVVLPLTVLESMHVRTVSLYWLCVTGSIVADKCLDWSFLRHAQYSPLQVDPLNCGGCHSVCAQGIKCCFGQCQDCPGGKLEY